MLDNKDVIKDYWNSRWKSQGERGGVSEFQKIDKKYIGRNRRDEERLTDALISANKSVFYLGAECGAGAGRLTPFYNRFVKNLSCFDISEEAKNHFARQGLDNDYIIMPLSEIGREYSDMFDIAITFTVVQHIHGRDEFTETLKSIQESLRVGGIYLLHEDISAFVQKRMPAVHMNGFGTEDYGSILDKCENIYSREYYYKETNENDLVAVYKKIK